MTIHIMPCHTHRGGCGYDIPVTPKKGEQNVVCPKCGKRFDKVFLEVDVRGVEVFE